MRGCADVAATKPGSWPIPCHFHTCGLPELLCPRNVCGVRPTAGSCKTRSNGAWILYSCNSRSRRTRTFVDRPVLSLLPHPVALETPAILVWPMLPWVGPRRDRRPRRKSSRYYWRLPPPEGFERGKGCARNQPAFNHVPKLAKLRHFSRCEAKVCSPRRIVLHERRAGLKDERRWCAQHRVASFLPRSCSRAMAWPVASQLAY